jgi:tetratricopeptide (TPR) repeat protein
MKSLFLYELVLLIAGFILFLALVFALIFSLVKNKPLKNIFWFFLFPIIMIGFPSIESLGFENGKFEIKKLTNQVAMDPLDETKRKELEEAIQTINKDRINKDSEGSKYIAEAHLALGNIAESEKAIQNAITLEKNDPEAIKINNEIKRVKIKTIEYKKNIEKLGQILTKIEAREGSVIDNSQALKEILIKAEVPLYTDEKSQVIIAKSLGKLGDKENSVKILDKILLRNPNSEEAKSIKKELILSAKDRSNLPTLKINKFDNLIIKKE